MSDLDGSAMSSLSTWDALCKDCRNQKLRTDLSGKRSKKRKNDLRQEQYEYSDVHAARQFERGQSRSDRCPECRKQHKKEIAAFPVAYIDIAAIGEAEKYVVDPVTGPTGPLGGLGPLPHTHSRRTESVDLKKFALGLTDADIVNLLGIMTNHQVVVLEAGTGTGKSTLAPFRLMNPPDGAPYRPTDVGPIFVTEPRVPATTEVAHFVGEAMCFGHDSKTCFDHVGPGYPVGYQCQGKKVWDEACSLVYVTDGSMINMIVNGDLARIGTVIIDEAHERSENIDNVLTLLAAKLPRYPHLRVVIASATIDKTYFVKYFEKSPSIRVGHYEVKAPKQIGYGVPLFSDIDFDDEVLTNGFAFVDPRDRSGEPRFTLPGWPDEPNSEESNQSPRTLTRDLYLGLRSPAEKWPDKKNVLAAAVTQTMKILMATSSGDILVFLPNQKLVLDARSKIELAISDAAADLGTVSVYWLMSKTKDAEKKRALAPCPAGERKVVVASNLAETSLTIDGLKYVVDSGLVNQKKWDPSLAVAHLPLQEHSQSGIRQRWGRVGRKTHGWVFPLYSLANYLAMHRDTPAGSTAANLEGTILKLIAAGEDPSTIAFPADFDADGLERDSAARESAENFRRERARALAALQTNGAVGADGKTLTRLGAELTRSRLSPEQAIALMFADRLACVPEVATALVALSGKDDKEHNRGQLAGPDRILAADRKWPIEWNVHARKCHEALTLGCEDDLDLVIRVFASWKAAKDPSAWCAQWWINEDVLVELSSAAATLMDSLARGMSKEAKRPLDPHLGGRARAVFSRALGSLRYSRIDENKWQSTNPIQPDAVTVSPQRLLPVADHVIGLVRARPNEHWAGKIVHEGELLGLVSSLDWAARDEPSDFELLRRVSLRHEELQNVSDPAQRLRIEYPVGARVRVRRDTSGSLRLDKLTDGLAMPAAIIGQPELDGGVEIDDDSAMIYTSETESSEGSGPVKAGMEVPEEEIRLTPIRISELETPGIEDFTGYEPFVGVPASEASSRETNQPQEVVATHHVQSSDDWRGIVSGYRIDQTGVQLVLDPTANDEERPRQVGDSLQVVVVGPSKTHVGVACEVRECAATGEPLLTEPLYIEGATVDDVRGPDAVAPQPGSIWSARVVPSRSGYAATTISVADSVFSRITTNVPATSGVKAPTVVSFTATLTGDSHRDWQEQVNAIATTDAFGPDLIPEFCIWSGRLANLGVAAQSGTRLKVELKLNDRARSGKWKPEDVEFIVGKNPDLFEVGHKPEFISSRGYQPVSEVALGVLLDVDPASTVYELNAWQYWENSRHLVVRRVSALGEAEVSPEVAVSLKRKIDLRGLQRQFSVGISIKDDGSISVSGDPPNVAAALDHLRGTALQSRTAIQLPGRPDGKYPVFPTRKEFVTALEPNIDDTDDTTELARSYNPRNGQLVARAGLFDASRAPEIAGYLQSRFQYFSVHLTFAEERGFLAFQKKDRWTTIASTVDDLRRWLVDGGAKVWGVYAQSEATLSEGIAAIRGALSSVPFDVSGTEGAAPTIIELPAITDIFEVSYISPKQAVVESIPHSPDEISPDSESKKVSVTATPSPSVISSAKLPTFSQGLSPVANGLTGRGIENAQAEVVIDVTDNCRVVVVANDSNMVEICADDLTRCRIPRVDYLRDPRPLHWIREEKG